MKPYKIVFKQEDYDGNMYTGRTEFDTKDEYESWRKGMKKSADYIGKPFWVVKDKSTIPN